MKIHLEYVTANGVLKNETFEAEIQYTDHARNPFGTAMTESLKRINKNEGWGAVDVKRISVSYET